MLNIVFEVAFHSQLLALMILLNHSYYHRIIISIISQYNLEPINMLKIMLAHSIKVYVCTGVSSSQLPPSHDT